MKKRLISLALAMVMLCTMIPIGAITVSAAANSPTIDGDIEADEGWTFLTQDVEYGFPIRKLRINDDDSLVQDKNNDGSPKYDGAGNPIYIYDTQYGDYYRVDKYSISYAFDEEYIYLAVETQKEVKTKNYPADKHSFEGEDYDIYKAPDGDSGPMFNFIICPDKIEDPEKLKDGDFSKRIETGLINVENGYQSNLVNLGKDELTVIRNATDDGYACEIRIPVSALNFTPQNGDMIYFDISIKTGSWSSGTHYYSKDYSVSKYDKFGSIEYEVTPDHEHEYVLKSENGQHYTGCADPTCDLNTTAERENCSGGEATCILCAICDVCEEEYGDVDSTNHNDESFTWGNTNEVHWRICGDCQQEYGEREGHTTEDGVCSDCGLEGICTEINDGSWEYDYDANEHWLTHGECTIKHELAPHEEGEWVIEREANKYEPGLLTTTCTVCNCPMTQEIPYESEEEAGNGITWIIMMMLTKKFTLTAEAGEGGTISSVGETKVRFNKDVTYTITPNSGYSIEAVYVDGENVGAVSSYTFDNVRKAHTIKVTFKKN